MNKLNEIPCLTGTNVNESEFREPLFPDEEESEFINTMDVTRCIYAIRQIEKRITHLKMQLEEATVFYAQKITQHQTRIDFFKRSILAFLQQHEMRNIQTPCGTAYQKEVTSKVWPPDEQLIAWTLKHLPDALRIKREPDKRLICDHIKNTGETPDGYEETKDTRLYLK